MSPLQCVSRRWPGLIKVLVDLGLSQPMRRNSLGLIGSQLVVVASALRRQTTGGGLDNDGGRQSGDGLDLVARTDGEGLLELACH